MRVNKINLSDHAATSMSQERAAEELEHFLQKGMRQNSDKKLIPVGHNIGFDLDFVWHHLMAEDKWRRYCTYPAIDTAVLARFFGTINKIPGFYNLVALRQLFQIETGEAHHALPDVLANLALAQKFFLMRKVFSVYTAFCVLRRYALS